MSEQTVARSQHAVQRRDDPQRIELANAKMRQAWQDGRELVERFDARATYGAMKELSGGDKSTAQRHWTYRKMASRITQNELEAICELTLRHGKCWGPTFLVTLSRVETRQERWKLAKIAIEEQMGLIEFQRLVRLRLPPQNTARRTTRVGRKRRLNWQDEAAILDEMCQLCLSWLHFHEDLRASPSPEQRPGLEFLPSKLRKHIGQAAAMMAELQTHAKKRLGQKARS